ncbi:MAG: hypothetical protein KAS32_11120 [Candidatus Peribacteraceae bacterium]|nr:hypothetical protein [Candidatus Peribacteraceae bacterium]
MYDPIWMDKHMKKKRGKMNSDWKREADIQESKIYIGIYTFFCLLWVIVGIKKYTNQTLSNDILLMLALMVPFYITMVAVYIRRLRRDMTYHLIDNLTGEATQGPKPKSVSSPPPPPRGFGGCCFPAGTMITMFDGSNKAIEDIDIDDVVLTYSTQNDDYIGNSVAATIKSKASEFIVVNDRIKSTPTHRYYRADGENCWVEARQLSLDTPLLDVKSKDKKTMVNSLKNEKLDEAVYVYNLTVENMHNYFANGLLVHNMKA